MSVFLLTLGENLGYHCANIASNYILKDYMKNTFEEGVFPALDLAAKLLQLKDIELWNQVELCGGQPTYALSWILTWFSHDIDDIAKVQLVFDACLATHPLFAVYITVAQILLSKRDLLEQETPEISGFIVFREMRENQSFNIEESIELAHKIYREFPPDGMFKLIEKDNKSTDTAKKEARRAH